MKKLKKPSIRTVNHRDGGMSFYAEGGEFDFVRNQSPNPTTNFEKRMYHTPHINNQDGSMSSHKMMFWSDDKGYYAAPTIVQLPDGRLHEFTNPDEAINYAYNTGEYKTFSSPEESEAYANNGYKFGTPMEMFAPNEGFRTFANGGETNNPPSLYPAPSLAFQKKVQNFVKQKDAQVKEQEQLQKQVKGKKVIASLKPVYNNAMHTDTTGPYGNGYTQEQQRYFESKKIPTHLWAAEQKKLDDAAIVARRKQIQQQAIKDLEKQDFTKARAENLTNAFRFFPDDPSSFIDDYLNPFQLTGLLAGNLGSNFASDAGPLNAKKLALDIAAPLAVGMFGSLGAESTGQFINNLVNPLAGTGQFLTTRTPLKNSYKLNPFAIRTPEEVILHRVQKPGQTAEYLMGQHYASKPFDSLTLNQKIKATRSNQPGFGRGFSSDFKDISYYSNPNIMQTRGYSGNPEILRIRIPKNELPEFSIKNYNKGKSIENQYYSEAPKKEFILPIDKIQNAEKFSINDIKKLREEFDIANTPHWLKGYKPISNRMFEEGGEYELTQEEIDNLKSQGYDLELL